MGIFTENTTAVKWWQGCFCLTFFKFFFGYGHGNFFGILVNRNDISCTEVGNRSTILSFRSDMSNNQTISTTRENVRLSRGQPCLLDLYQRSLMKRDSISGIPGPPLGPTKRTTTTSPSTIHLSELPESHLLLSQRP